MRLTGIALVALLVTGCKLELGRTSAPETCLSAPQILTVELAEKMLAEAEAKALQSMRSALSALEKDDMQKFIGLLSESARAEGAAGAMRMFAEASRLQR